MFIVVELLCYILVSPLDLAHEEIAKGWSSGRIYRVCFLFLQVFSQILKRWIYEPFQFLEK